MTGVTASPGGTAAERARVMLLTRADCHLCIPVREIVGDVCAEDGTDWVDVDIDEDEELCGEFGDQIPVVLVDGEFLAAHDLRAAALRDALNRSV